MGRHRRRSRFPPLILTLLLKMRLECAMALSATTMSQSLSGSIDAYHTLRMLGNSGVKVGVDTAY